MLDVILVVILYHRNLTTKKQMDTNSAFKKSMKLFFKIFLLPPLIYLLTHFIPSTESPILPMAYKNNFSYLTKAERIGLGVLSNGFNLFYPVWIPYYYGITYYRYNFKKDEFKINERIKRTKNLCKKEKDCLPYMGYLLSKKEEGIAEYKELVRSLYLGSSNEKKCKYYPSLYRERKLFQEDAVMMNHALTDAFKLHKEDCKYASYIAYKISFEQKNIITAEKILKDVIRKDKGADLVQIGNHFISEFYNRKKIKNVTFFTNGKYRSIYSLISQTCEDIRRARRPACRYINEILTIRSRK